MNEPHSDEFAQAQPALPARRIRHDGWTPERIAIFLEVLADTGIVTDAAQSAGMHRDSAYSLRTRNPVFAAAWRAAETHARPVVADGLRERSITGTVEHYYRDGVLVGERRHYESWLGIAVLKRLDKQAEEDRAEGSLSARMAGDWMTTLETLRAGGTEAVENALQSNKADKADIPPPPGLDPADNMWRAGSPDDPGPSRERGLPDGAWMTVWPPPPSFDGYQNCIWDGDRWYERACTPEEAALLDAHEAAMIDAERRELSDYAVAERDGFFARLKSELASSAQPADDHQHQPAGDRVGEPVEDVAVAVEHRDCLDDLDQRSEQREADGDADERGPGIGPGAERSEGGEGDDVLDLVVGLAGEVRRVGHDGHDEGEDRRAPEEQALGGGGPDRASHDSTGL